MSAELSRLQALSAVNPNIHYDEIDALERALLQRY
ncbi:hypothetical protein EWM60_18120 [Candidatus Erwinia dacicola]|nr:hypothetical protein [Candidatus Erwinia dacicola]